MSVLKSLRPSGGLKSSSINLTNLKRPPIFISLIVVVVLLAAWWLGWMSPEASKLSTIKQHEQSLTAELQTLNQQLLTDQHDSALVTRDAKFLGMFARAVPPAAEAGPLTTQLYDLSRSTHVSLTGLTDNSVVAPVAGSLVGSIPIAISLKGSHQACFAFLSGLYKIPRLVTVGSVTPAPGATAGTAPANVLARDNLPYTMTIGASAYFFATAAG